MSDPVEAAYREWAAPRPRSMTDDDFDAFRAGWDAAIREAARKCREWAGTDTNETLLIDDEAIDLLLLDLRSLDYDSTGYAGHEIDGVEARERLLAFLRGREARIWEEAAKFVSLHGLSPGTRGMCVELAKAMNEKAAALRARGGKQ